MPEDKRLAYNRMLPGMQAFKAILQNMQLKLMIGNVSSIGRNDVHTFINDLIYYVYFVQDENNNPFAGLFVRSVIGLLTSVNSIILHLNTAKLLAEDLERIDTTTPNYAAARATTYMEFQRYLLACQEPLNQALALFTIH